MSNRIAGLVVLCACVLVGDRANGQAPIKSVVVDDTVKQPVYVTHAPKDFERVFIVEGRAFLTTGRVRIYDLESESLIETPFLELPVLTDGESGLLGMAFDPDYDENGHFYINYTAPGGGEFGQNLIERYTVSEGDPNVADMSSAQLVLSIDQPKQQHNSHWLDFGPDGYLYIASGDGGSGFAANAQDIEVLYGKILRLDVTGDDFPSDDDLNYAIPVDNPFVGGPGADEVWAYGLRNPWRCSFDRATGDLYIGDVGQASWEEVNYQPADSTGGENYGWVCAEGPDCGCSDCGATVLPIHAFDHYVGNAIMGGYVYRGCSLPELDGRYFFAAIGTGRVFSFTTVNGEATDLQEHTDQLDLPDVVQLSPVSFGEDAYGELYVVYITGDVIKIVRDGAPLEDCDGNGVEDACDIADGTLADEDGDGVPDDCVTPCAADLNGDGELNVFDFITFQTLFAAMDQKANCNEDLFFNILDFVCYQQSFAEGC